MATSERGHPSKETSGSTFSGCFQFASIQASETASGRPVAESFCVGGAADYETGQSGDPASQPGTTDQVRGGKTLQQAFIDLVGAKAGGGEGLSWLGSSSS